jgi:tetratricopeptide (TPR) repeat protein
MKITTALSSVLLLVTAVTSNARSQGPTLTGAAKWADSAAREIDAASDAGDLVRIRAARTNVERALVAFPNDPYLLYYKAYALFREAGLQEGLQHQEELRSVLDDEEKALDASLAVKAFPEAHAMLSSVLGRKIAFRPVMAMVLGPRSGSEMSDAIALGPNNPRVWLIRGQGAIFTPEQFGGGLTNAEAYLKKAEQLFVMDNATAPAPSWGRAELYAWLGQVYQKQNKKAEAIAAYNKALEIDPNMRWVKFVLLPSTQNR